MTPKIEQIGDSLIITQTVPLEMSGSETYGDGTWTAPAICIYVRNSHNEYGLFHTQYLDYKDSLQPTWPILYFETKEKALEVAKKFKLTIIGN